MDHGYYGWLDDDYETIVLFISIPRKELTYSHMYLLIILIYIALLSQSTYG